jgi:hypothetical protein
MTTRPPRPTATPSSSTPASCSTTGYIQDAIDAHRAAGHEVSEQTIADTSRAIFEVINPYGTLNFDVAGILSRTGRRPCDASNSR